MIVVGEGDATVTVTQEAHAHLTGELAARLAPPPGIERSAFVAAARLHDNGWREADADPPRGDDGHPLIFFRVPAEVYEAVWRRGITRAAAVDPLVGLLVGLHGARFFAANPDPRVRALHEEERARQDRVLAELGLGGTWRDLPSAVAAASDWIAFLDRVSLQVCGALPDALDTDVAGATHRTVLDGALLTIDPWPFLDPGGPVTVPARPGPVTRTLAPVRP